MNLARAIIEEEELPKPWWRKLYGWITLFISNDQLGYMAMIVAASVVRAMGVTVQSGETGLLFTFGRARQELQPGFRLLVPFLQTVKRMPSRSRTLDLPAQRVVTLEGLVYQVDANLVYRVVDIRKAVIQIDSLRKGMLQILGLSVQETLRPMTREELNEPEELRRRLTNLLQERLAAWGAQVEHAGFTSITPSAKTLRVTQFSRTTLERVRVLAALEASGIEPTFALGLVGTRKRFERRTRARVLHANRQTSRRRVRVALLREGIHGARLGNLLRQAQRSPTERHSTFELAEADGAERDLASGGRSQADGRVASSKGKAAESKPGLASR